MDIKCEFDVWMFAYADQRLQGEFMRACNAAHHAILVARGIDDANEKRRLLEIVRDKTAGHPDQKQREELQLVCSVFLKSL